MPAKHEVHINGPLSTFVASYDNGDFIADELAPVIEVDAPSATHATYDRKDITTPQEDKIGLLEKARGVDYSVGKGTYLCVDRALVGHVPNALLDTATDPQRPRERTSKVVTTTLMLNRELRVRELCFTPGNFAAGNAVAVTDPWTDETNGNPRSDIESMIVKLPPGAMNLSPTKLVAVCSKETFLALRAHPSLRGPGSVTRVLTVAEIADLLMVDEIKVSDATYWDGSAHTRIWTTGSFGVFRVPVGDPADEAGNFAVTFRHMRNGSSAQVRTWDEPSYGKDGAEAIQVSLSDDEKIIQNDQGVLLTSVI